jgi:hypothetical protein
MHSSGTAERVAIIQHNEEQAIFFHSSEHIFIHLWLFFIIDKISTPTLVNIIRIFPWQKMLGNYSL